MEGIHLGAVCGLYCGACTLYRARHDIDRKDAPALLETMAKRLNVPVETVVCEGCLSKGPLSPYCTTCEIRKCALSRPGVSRCSECTDFPCALITRFSNDGVPHHSPVLKSISRQKKIGILEWCEEQYEKIRCQYCGVSVDWYARTCHRCGKQNPTTITSFLGDTLQPYYRA